MEKKEITPKNKVMTGISMTVFGIIWQSVSQPRDTFFAMHTPWFVPVIGVVLIIGGVITAGIGIKEMQEEKAAAARERIRMAEREKRAEKEAAPGTPVRKSETAAGPGNGEKKMVFCPYCKTAQDADYRICSSCGAGRTQGGK